ncbi:UMF1 family MFS transporter [Bogoriella caseilytica]|uniref:UMF1 family MFS transporter n=1 Tax=Bogoriella caseilytica TaxID=56055 RepID=A0A3N2BDA0_9MICO|nr:UMF1 family MFS transporter [Bogoriella caseilytica]
MIGGLPEEASPRRTVRSWILWDLGSNAFNTTILSFVYTVYLVDQVAATPAEGQLVYSRAQLIAGILVALLAPLMGAWADRVANRRRLLTLTSLLAVVCMAAMYFVPPEPNYLILGVTLVAVCSLITEIAGVFYHGMLHQISTAKTVGRISGIGWASGYVGGMLTLVIAVVFVQFGGQLGLPTDNLENVRMVGFICAGWMLLFSLPIMFWGPTTVRSEALERKPLRLLGTYRDIGRTIAGLWRSDRPRLHFLIAAAIYRDGLSAVFAFAGVIASASYGMDQTQIIMFAIGANIAAALGAFLLGGLDDRFGPKPVIVGALAAIIVFGAIIVGYTVTMVEVEEPPIPLTWVFVMCGLGLSSFVGAAQSASRTLLTRMTPAKDINEMFGLYATVGRGVSFISPALIAAFTSLGIAVYGTESRGQFLGMLGIVLTLVLGLLAFLPLKARDTPPAP